MSKIDGKKVLSCNGLMIFLKVYLKISGRKYDNPHKTLEEKSKKGLLLIINMKYKKVFHHLLISI